MYHGFLPVHIRLHLSKIFRVRYNAGIFSYRIRFTVYAKEHKSEGFFPWSYRSSIFRVHLVPLTGHIVKIFHYFSQQVVNGSPLVARVIHQPLSSFDAEGRYVGLSHLAQMLQNTPDTPEPESPYDIYESSINLSSEQRSPVAQVPTDDPRVILNKVKI